MTDIVTPLKKVLADSYALYLKTQNYHWNVEGPSFQSLHVLFEQQYTELAMAIDTVAELIRGLGEKAPGTFKAFMTLCSIAEGKENAKAESMVKDLHKDQEKIQKTIQTALDAAQKEKDEVVAGFLIERLTAHRKNAWMLQSSLH